MNAFLTASAPAAMLPKTPLVPAAPTITVSPVPPSTASSSPPALPPTTSAPDLLTCTPKALSTYLLTTRFQNSTPSTTTFLTSCLTTLGSTHTPTAIAPPPSFGKLLSTHANVQFITPRGRFTVTCYEEGVMCVNAKQTEFLHIPAAATATIISLSKPDLYTKDQSKQTDKLLVIVLKDKGVPFKKSSIDTICMQASEKDLVDVAGTPPDNTTTTTSSSDAVPAKLPAPSVYFTAVATALKTVPTYTDNTTFVSSSGLPFVQCYNKVNQGFLYPLVSGLLFFKPPLFVPRGDLVSIACGRGGGGGGTRFVDMNCVLEEGGVEFSNIDREELAGVNAYINGPLMEAMQRDATGEPASVKAESADSPPPAPVAALTSQMSEGRGGRPKRRAAVLADEQNRATVNDEDDDDEDDEDCVDDENSEGGSDDSEDDSDDDEFGGSGSDGSEGEEMEEENLLEEIQMTIKEAGEDVSEQVKKKPKMEEEEGDEWGVQ